MRISPIDIQQQQFKSRLLGYDKAEVDRFLESVAEELERLLRKNQDLQEELDRVNATVAGMYAREETLKETLVTTQQLTQQLKATTRRETEVMLADAEVKSERIKQNAEERRIQLIGEIQELKRQKIDFESGLRSLLEKHIRMLELHSMEIDQQGADAKLLEEPLPFVDTPPTPKKTAPPAQPAPQKTPPQKTPPQKTPPQKTPPPAARATATATVPKRRQAAPATVAPTKATPASAAPASKTPQSPDLSFDLAEDSSEDIFK